MRKFYFLLGLIFFTSKAITQDVITDSKGNFLFGVPTTTIQPQISSNNVGITSPIRNFYKKLYYTVNDDTNDTVYTMAKSKVFFIKANVVNNTKSTLIFNGKTNYSPSMELGLSWGFDSLINPSSKTGFYKTYSVSVFGEYQNFNYYDTITQRFGENKTNRVSPGIKANITLFRLTKYAISLSGTYQYSILTDKLTSYQKRPNTFYFDNSISTNGQNDGYISPVEPIGNYRLSLSVPQFWLSGKNNKKLPFAVTPYYFGVFAKGQAPNNNIGIVLSLLGQSFHRYDNNSDGSFDKNARFKFAQSLNLGYNFISTGNIDPQYFFVSGTFSLAAFKPKKTLSSERTR
jgi:hypothetical protein